MNWKTIIPLSFILTGCCVLHPGIGLIAFGLLCALWMSNSKDADDKGPVALVIEYVPQGGACAPEEIGARDHVLVFATFAEYKLYCDAEDALYPLGYNRAFDGEPIRLRCYTAQSNTLHLVGDF